MRRFGERHWVKGLLDITTDQQAAALARGVTLALTDAHRLTLHDAAYLELARRRGSPLATLDRDPRDASDVRAVRLLGH